MKAKKIKVNSKTQFWINTKLCKSFFFADEDDFTLCTAGLRLFTASWALSNERPCACFHENSQERLACATASTTKAALDVLTLKLEATSPARKKRKTKLYAFLDCDFDNEILLKRVRYSHSKNKDDARKEKRVSR